MAKIIRTALFITAYTFIYIFLMFLCQIVFGLTIGGAGGDLFELLPFGTPADQEQLAKAVTAAELSIDDFVQKNAGLLVSISALLSLLIFIKIFSARKLNLFSAVRMDSRPSGIDIRYGAFAGASSNFVISLVVVILQNFNLFNDAFSQYDAHIETIFGSGGIALTLLSIGMVVPLVEEILFRGMVIYELKNAFSWKTAIIAQGVIFGLYHLIPVQIFYTIPLGVYFGFIVYKTGSVWPAAAGHIAMNAISILMSAPAIISMFNSPMFSLLFIIMSVYMFISALRYFVNKKPAQTIPD